MPSDKSVVNLQDIKRVYYKPDGSVLVEALAGIDLEIPDGQSIAIMGASGSGKSTLMNILGCLDRATQGSTSLTGRMLLFWMIKHFLRFEDVPSVLFSSRST